MAGTDPVASAPPCWTQRDFFAPDDLADAALALATGALAFGAAVLAFAFTEAALDDLAAAGAFALAADGDLALVVEDFLVEVDFGLGESDSFSALDELAPP